MRALLFTDVEGSTALLQLLGSAWPDALGRYQALVAQAVGSAGGSVFNTEGDGVFAMFDSVGAALGAAVDAQRALSAEPWPQGRAVRVRMAIHVGEVTDTPAGLVGLALHVTSRACAAANGDQILVTGDARDALGDGLDGIALSDLGWFRLRSLPSDVRLFQVQHPWADRILRPPRVRGITRHNLPASAAGFVGREDEIQAVRAALGERRLVSLTGPGGSGKTSLAIEVARRHLVDVPDGAWLVELAPLADDTLVAPAMARALGLREQPGAGPIEAVCEYLTGREALLVVDNAEHVIAGVRSLVAEVLSTCPAVRVLTTSRQALGSRDECVFVVPPLGLPTGSVADLSDLAASDAGAFLLDRVAMTGFVPEQRDAPVLAAICQRLDGLPLAIELVAGRLKVLTPSEVSDRLDAQLPLLVGGGGRHATMRAALDWSHDLLTSSQRLLFRRLAVFVGPWTLGAAEAVCTDEQLARSEVLEHLEGLVDRSLVIVDRGVTGNRFRLLEPVRQFAVELIDQAGERDETEKRFIRWAVDLSREGGSRYLLEQAKWDPLLRADQPNFRRALELALERDDAISALRIGAALGWFWFTVGYAEEGRGWLEAALAQAPLDLPDHVRANALMSLGGICGTLADYEVGDAALLEAKTLFERLGRDSQAAWAQWWLARGRETRGHTREMTNLIENCVARFRALDESFGLGWSLIWMAIAWHEDGRFQETDAALEEACTIGRELAIPGIHGAALGQLARRAAELGDLDAEARFLAEAENVFRAVGDRWQLAGVLSGQVYSRMHRADMAGAATIAAEALELALEVASDERMATAMANAAEVIALAGEQAIAIQLAGSLGAGGWSRLGGATGSRERLRSLVGERVASGDFEQAWRAGARLGRDDAAHLALATLRAVAR